MFNHIAGVGGAQKLFQPLKGGAPKVLRGGHKRFLNRNFPIL